MALSPMTPVPITWQNCLVDLQPTSQFGADHDTAMINTTMQLSSPSAEEVVFVLPTAEEPEQAPMMRVIADAPLEAHEFEETSFDDVEADLAEAFEKAQEADRALWELVKQHASGGVSRTKVKIKQGDQLVWFFYPQKVPRLDDGSYEFRVLAPLASFVLATGGSLSFAVGLPRIHGRAISLQQAVAENPPGTSVGDLSERPVLGQRQFVAHFLQNDPLYRVRYTYA